MISQGTNIIKEAKSNRLVIAEKLDRIDFLDSRVYRRSEGVYYPSVTSILQYFPKDKFFESWLKDMGYNADIVLEKAGREGSQVHDAAEKLVKGEEVRWLNEDGTARYSLQVWEMILKFHEFWTTINPELKLIEEFVYSDTHQYAGTADLVVKINKEIWLIDLKTSNSLHDSYNLQLASYAKAIEELGGKIDRTGILWLKSLKRGPSKQKDVIQGKGWELKPIDEIDRNFDMFKHVHEIFKYKNPIVEPIYNGFPTSVKI